MNNLEQRIRDLAYQIWEDEGRPEGRAEVHWQQAHELVTSKNKARFKKKAKKTAH